MDDHEHDPPQATPKVRNEKPFFYPWNRRLRHLHGISLRNLHVTAPSPRKHAKTITDDDAPYNLTSPSKRALKSDAQSLPQSRSFTNLISVTGEAHTPNAFHKAATSYEKNEKQTDRPRAGRMRRRSTLHWTSASPRARQSKLEDMVVDRLADSWISIHSPDSTEPVYISEVIERSMNPSFAFFDLDNTDSQVARSDEGTIRVWAKASNADEYCLLVELALNLRSLQFIGRTLENFHHPLPQNCVLLHLSDGIYTSFTDLPADVRSGSDHLIDHKEGSARPGVSFDVLMQLANLDECIQDAINVRTQLEEDINKLIADSHLFSVNDEGPSRLESDEPRAEAALASEQKHLRQLTKRRDEKQESLTKRRNALSLCREELTKTRKSIEDRTKSCQEIESLLQQTDKDSTGQVRRICEALLTIYPIEPIKGRTLQFTIRGIHLPNSVYNDTNRDEIAAALGFSAQLVHHLSLYLSVPLPYPIEPYGSSSFISDPISIGLSQRRYPLHPTTVPYKFEYGVFLLNKDIEFLMNRAQLRVLDIRHTLPNLKYLLYVLTAGTGDLPPRTGGIRGLLGGRMGPEPLRRDSEESVQSLPSALGADSNQGRINGGFASPKEKDINDRFVSTSPALGVSYRHGFKDTTGR
ncbi:hypothetical protein PV08_02168 [Exophiala spinifera]|uniref:Autophagy-related protein 14 n=1 Tax=Exophiala spinifera TaxID=91928 RepID=A0A0D2BRB5_9EURO|nr:uncharacterized protein PV08_02168 [Exophiala spinifera]KIW21588.1 hypothetical protein PV08_02168 [Exophiala spinifera]